MSRSPVEVLVVDDDPLVHELLRPYLSDEGFEVLDAFDGSEGLAIAYRHRPGVVLLDRRMPGLSGHDVLVEMRRRGIESYVIFLTASSDEFDRVVGLELGADDYITKPFSARETVSRIKAVLRRRRASPAPFEQQPPATFDGETIVAGDLELDTRRRTAALRGTEIGLTPTEFRLLETFCAHPGRAFSRTELLDRVSTSSRELAERSLDSHIAHLRRKIRAASPARRIVTICGFGYKFCPHLDPAAPP